VAAPARQWQRQRQQARASAACVRKQGLAIVPESAFSLDPTAAARSGSPFGAAPDRARPAGALRAVPRPHRTIALPHHPAVAYGAAV